MSRLYKPPTWVAVRLVVREALDVDKLPSVNGPRAVYNLLAPEVAQRPREAFWVVHLSTQHKVLHIEEVSNGVLDSALVHPREVFQGAILANAAAIVVVHNHPGAEPHPSPEDVDTTDRLVKAGQIIGIPVLDHIVIGSTGRYVSFSEMGMLRS